MASNPLAGLRILLLEDEYLIAMDVELLCRDNGAAEIVIKRALDELEALDGFDRFDVAVVDLMLAGASTLPFAAKLRDAGVPFIFASGYAGDEALTAFPGATVISKPYAGNDLLEAIATAARR